MNDRIVLLDRVLFLQLGAENVRYSGGAEWVVDGSALAVLGKARFAGGRVGVLERRGKGTDRPRRCGVRCATGCCRDVCSLYPV
jgi:hypothetical protein